MKVLVTGGTGFIGSHLVGRLGAARHSMILVSRRPENLAQSGGSHVIRACGWSDDELRRAVFECDAILHLAGENLFDKRWTAEQKKRLWTSRVETTKKLAALAAERKPACFLSASAIGWYGPSDDTPLDERSPRGSGFLADLCAAWEDAAEAAAEAGVRACRVRTGITLGQSGGALSKMLPFFRLGIGGPLGDGSQWWSWIHIADLCRLYLFLLEDPRASGAFDGTSPNPVTMKEAARALGRVLHRPSVLPVPKPMLRLTLGELAEALITGQRVLPRRALEAGFRFEHPEIESALRDLLGKSERIRS